MIDGLLPWLFSKIPDSLTQPEREIERTIVWKENKSISQEYLNVTHSVTGGGHGRLVLFQARRRPSNTFPPESLLLLLFSNRKRKR
jgi:hypothetical protein